MSWRWSSARLTWESPRRWASPTGGHTSSGPSGAVASWVVPAYPRRWSRCICLERTVHLVIVQTGWLAGYRLQVERLTYHQGLSPVTVWKASSSMSSPPELAELLYWPRVLLYSWSVPFISSTALGSGRREGGRRKGELGRGGWWWMDGRRRWEWS